MTSYMGPRRSLAALRTSDRILITLFSFAIAVAMLVGVLNYYERTHLTAQGTEEWYRGNEQDRSPESLQFPKTTLELLEVTHPHLFFQSIMFFILCHMFSMTQVSDRSKIVVYFTAFGAVFTEAGLPWLIRYASGLFAPLLIASTTVMSLMILVLLIVPLYEMWWAATPPSQPPQPLRERSVRSLP